MRDQNIVKLLARVPGHKALDYKLSLIEEFQNWTFAVYKEGSRGYTIFAFHGNKLVPNHTFIVNQYHPLIGYADLIKSRIKDSSAIAYTLGWWTMYILEAIKETEISIKMKLDLRGTSFPEPTPIYSMSDVDIDQSLLPIYSP